MLHKMTEKDDKRKVRFVNKKAHETQPEFYPKVGTIGFVVWCKHYEGEGDWYVMWPKNSVYGKFGTEEEEGYVGRFCGEESIEFVEEDFVEIVSAIEEKEKIWKEVAPELEKTYPNIYWDVYWADKDCWKTAKNLIDAVVIAYRTGSNK